MKHRIDTKLVPGKSESRTHGIRRRFARTKLERKPSKLDPKFTSKATNILEAEDVQKMKIINDESSSDSEDYVPDVAHVRRTRSQRSSEEEDKILAKELKPVGRKWKTIMEALPGKSINNLRTRADVLFKMNPNPSSAKKLRSNWTYAEDAYLIELIQFYEKAIGRQLVNV